MILRKAKEQAGAKLAANAAAAKEAEEIRLREDAEQAAIAAAAPPAEAEPEHPPEQPPEQPPEPLAQAAPAPPPLPPQPAAAAGPPGPPLPPAPAASPAATPPPPPAAAAGDGGDRAALLGALNANRVTEPNEPGRFALRPLTPGLQLRGRSAGHGRTRLSR